ncbi:hypothetical protein ACFU7X_18300 [Streptomyces chartreusis]|uniref:hypothetical protein n=1 Tax=Streptomyces chartreusis TaxID=1969 RepID=UPI0036A0A01C
MTERLTKAEIIAELHAVLTEGGWIPSLTSADGPGPLPRKACGLSNVATALAEHSRAGSLPPAAALQLRRAAQAAADALEADRLGNESAVYGMLGAALAYVVQARGVVHVLETPA